MIIGYLFIIICSFSLITCAVRDKSSTVPVDMKSSTNCEYDLSVVNDGPVTLDVPITFTTDLRCYSEKNKYLYVFEDDAFPSHKIDVQGNKSVSVSFVYPEKTYAPKEYIMKVTAYYGYYMLGFGKPLIYLKIMSKEVPFNITEFIPGDIDLSGVIKKKDDDNLYVKTGDLINMTTLIHYPRRVYKQSEMSYYWSIGEDQYITTVPYNSYKFTKTGKFNIRATAVARIPLYDNTTREAGEVKYKWGHYYKEVTVKDPFYAVNLTGNTYLQHGQLFNLDVSCNGSGPFEYCWKIFQPKENVTNLTCTSPVVTNQCSFPIIYYFHESGKYRIAIRVDNLVTELQRDIEVIVYDVSLRPQLSTVIIPLICSILVLFIIAAGVMLHIRHNQNVDIEIADFDFLQSDEGDIETSWERLYHSVFRFLTFCNCRNHGFDFVHSEKLSAIPRDYEPINH